MLSSLRPGFSWKESTKFTALSTAMPAARAPEPTGVGDAYRGGIIKGLLKGLPWETTGRIGSLAATYVLEQVGTQNHHYSLEAFVERYRRTFGDSLRLDDLLS